MNIESREEIVLEHRSRFWPVMLFPHFERSHTVGLIGWRDGRPRFVKDIALTSAGRLVLTTRRLWGKGHFFGLWCSIEIARRAIEAAEIRPDDEGLLEIRFHEARKKGWVRFVARGPLDGRVLLNLGDQSGRWYEALVGG